MYLLNLDSDPGKSLDTDSRGIRIRSTGDNRTDERSSVRLTGTEVFGLISCWLVAVTLNGTVAREPLFHQGLSSSTKIIVMFNKKPPMENASSANCPFQYGKRLIFKLT